MNKEINKCSKCEISNYGYCKRKWTNLYDSQEKNPFYQTTARDIGKLPNKNSLALSYKPKNQFFSGQYGKFENFRNYSLNI